MFSFYTPWKQKNLWFSEETSGFPMISEETIGLKRSNSLVQQNIVQFILGSFI